MIANTEKPKILVRFDRVYGKITCYPVNAAAQTITALTRKKTIAPRDLELARDLGFEITIEAGSAKVLNEFLGRTLTASASPEIAEFIDPSGSLRKASLLFVERPA